MPEYRMSDRSLPLDDAWDVFELDDDVVAEPQPEYGDFWGVLDDDCDDGS
jgi:hypothetical protein